VVTYRAVPTTTALIAALIVERPLCMDCLVSRADVSEREVETALSAIARAMAVHRRIDRCRACGSEKLIVVVGQPELS
jgi:hypothetical protein